MTRYAQARVECVLDARAESGETPVWSVAESTLFWVDQMAFRLHCLDPRTGRDVSWRMPAHISSFALRGAGEPIVVALRTGLFDFDRATGALNPVVESLPYAIESHRYNDGRCDRQGRYVIGSVDLGYFEHRVPGGAAVYRLDDQGLHEIVDDISCSNGIAFSPDGRTMYLADSARLRVYAFDYDTGTGTPSNRRVFAERAPGDGVFDGADVDSEGGYWVALLMKGSVARYTPDGALDREIEVPVLQPTKVAFGGPDLSTLYLTSAGHRHTPGDRPLGERAGGVFAIETGFRGIAEPAFRF